MTSQLQALKEAVTDIEAHVATGGWDGPVRVYALVCTGEIIAHHPDLAAELPADLRERGEANPAAIFALEQEGLEQVTSLDELIGILSWPQTVHGVAMSLERIILPPEAEASLPHDEEGFREAAVAHPQRDDVRMVVGVMRSGESWCALRMKSHDTPEAVLQGEDLVPDMVEALRSTFL